MKKRALRPFDAAAYQQAGSDYARNRLLLDWLSDDAARAAFYAAHADQPLFSFPGRAEDEPDTSAAARNQPVRLAPRRRAHFVLQRALVEEVLRDDGQRFSNLPYARIGSGGFMLALDPAATPLHALQRQAASQVFGTQDLDRLCALALRQAATIGLRTDAFDLAHFAEQTALRFCSLYFGFALKDFPLLEAALRGAYDALAYLNLGRHFVTDPLVLKLAEAPMGMLARRCAELIDDYAVRDPAQWPEDGMAPPDDQMAPPGGWRYQPVMRQLALHAGGPFTGSHMAVLVVGLLAGTVGNIQAATCIAVDALLRQPDWPRLTPAERRARCDQAWAQNPPVPFLPRRVLQSDARWQALGVHEGDELILAMGAATRGRPAKGATPSLDPLVFTTGATHDCLGAHLGLPLVRHLVDHVLALPGLARDIDPVLGTPMPLDKRWGFQCKALPLTHRRQQLCVQQPLNVAMRVKAPIAENAAKLREVIRVAGPRIDEALRASGLVHFAWFEFNDLDSTLVLHTVYDGDLDAYIEHFALSVGELFDLLFDYIEAAPPRPVAEHPFEFIALIRRVNRVPAGGYFFSAYPTVQTGQCVQRIQP